MLNFSTIFYKEDLFCHFLFPFLDNYPFLKSVCVGVGGGGGANSFNSFLLE